MRHYHGHFMNMPTPLRVLAIAGFAIVGLLIAAAMALLFGLVLMWLWNWLMPVIFGLPTITFWQAWGLVVLAHILFKTFPNHGHNDGHDEYWKKKFHKKFFEPSPDTEKENETTNE
ncbi:hypothetical protein EH223_10860 [candidate division KSB1 bacterium]|nr:hypothetical protein [candidate division KSB1 bacterium]RQW03121.1 MAG: hypothetical protein EH223_10860 [candidate division KSB1 bacterium]